MLQHASWLTVYAPCLLLSTVVPVNFLCKLPNEADFCSILPFHSLFPLTIMPSRMIMEAGWLAISVSSGALSPFFLWVKSRDKHRPLSGMPSSSSWDLSLPLHIHTEHTARLWCLEHGAWSIYYFPAFAVHKHHEYRWLLCAISVITSTRNFVKTVNLSNKALFLKAIFTPGCISETPEDSLKAANF